MADTGQLHPLIRRFLGYGATGGAAAVVDLGGYLVFLSFGLSVVLAAATSFLVAALVNYSLSARFVFRAQTKASGFLLFLAFAVVGFSINVSVTTAAQILLDAAPWLAKVTGIGCAFLVNFAMNNRYVFRDKDVIER